MTIVIQTENLAKKYLISHRHAPRNDTLRDELTSFVRRLGRPNQREQEEFWALKDVSFEIRQGDRVGIIGRNGAGKSTLLKILSRITEPTSGRISIRGRVASLLEVGTGFHPDLTGRENIFLNGAILGMHRDEIRKKFDEIVAFAEVEKFLDTPVKRYSSGMYVRLAFAVAAHLEPEILIVDEVLAVGDTAFQKKCMTKMTEAGDQGTTVLFVSHNIAAIQNLCRTAILLGAGQLIKQGETNSVISAYVEQSQQLAIIPLGHRQDRNGSGLIRFDAMEFRNAQGEIVSAFQCGQHVKVWFWFGKPVDTMLSNVVLSVAIENELGLRVACLTNAMAETPFPSIPDSIHCIELEIDKLPLFPGVYRLNLHCAVNGETADWIQHAGSITIEAGDYYGTGRLPQIANQGCLLVEHRFQLNRTADDTR